MSVEDAQIEPYFTLLTDVKPREINFKEPLAAKKRLAFEIVKNLHSQEEAKGAQVEFEKTVQKQELPTDIPIYQYTGNREQNIVDLLVKTKLVASRSEAKRLVEQGGVEIDGSTINNQQSTINVEDGITIRVGKRRYLKLEIRN